jgi:Cellulase (glycosyl hydrolase family 5)
MKCNPFFYPVFFCAFLLLDQTLNAQKKMPPANPVYVDKQGVLRWTSNKTEAAFFGVNYTTPFAYSYRAHKALNVDMEKAIQQDVYHMARLGFDAFRVHVWDTEISDSLGNLLENDHLRLFDFLLAELKKRHIKTIITPIAFWGNGYPERDERTPGFSRVFGKARATVNDTAIQAEENYVKQFFQHVNPYARRNYRDDPDVIAVEINNEPNHSGPKTGVTLYINRLAAAIRSTGWTKPVYYNISQSPYYADAVAMAEINGVSFQWYPSGLVANSSLKGNYLPNVDHYRIPFDTIPAYRNKSRMVYEFDAADILQSYMYPAIARSFREAGFQWATQFAYDPMALAYANTEYQTHYLNLAYTPSKAISMLIAAEVFHKIPRLKNYGVYPMDSVFDVFRVSYKNQLSEMNSDEKFYYSNTTLTKPVDPGKLKKIAGVGSSPVVQYQGSGAYFLDKLDEGIWRLELMPDAIHIRDPFERASPKKEVTRIQWQNNSMHILLPDLGQDFTINGLNEGNSYSGSSGTDSFSIQPGTYLLTGIGKKISADKNSTGPIGLHEFFAPKPLYAEIALRHEPLTEVSAGKPFTITAMIVGVDSASVSLQVSRTGGGQVRNIPMIRTTLADYSATVPADLVTPGVLNYRIIIQQRNAFTVFPGNIKTNPFAWDNYNNETWKTFVAAENGRLEIFNPTNDRNTRTYPSFTRIFQTGYITAEKPEQLILRLSITRLSTDHIMGFQHFFGDKLIGRMPEAGSFDKLVIRARTGDQPTTARVTLINADAAAFSTFISLTNDFRDIEIPLNDLKPDSALLMPRPYPGFLPLWFQAGGPTPGFTIQGLEKMEITIGPGIPSSELNKPYSLEIASAWFQKNK